jgi:hypothetical protein
MSCLTILPVPAGDLKEHLGSRAGGISISWQNQVAPAATHHTGEQ